MNWLLKLIGKSPAVQATPRDRPFIDPGRRPQTTPRAIAAGWNGLEWGAPTAAFCSRFPDAESQGDWLKTGLGRESFCGILMEAQYAFNRRDQFFMVALYPSAEDRERVSVAAVNELGAPDDMSLAWTVGDMVIDVKTGGLVVTITNRKLAN